MSIKSKKIAGNMRIKPVHILLAVPVWMVDIDSCPFGNYRESYHSSYITNMLLSASYFSFVRTFAF